MPTEREVGLYYFTLYELSQFTRWQPSDLSSFFQRVDLGQVKHKGRIMFPPDKVQALKDRLNRRRAA